MKIGELVDKVKSSLTPEHRPGNARTAPVGSTLEAKEHGQMVPDVGTARYARDLLADRPVLVPTIDAYESDTEWILRADVPGARPDNTQVWYDEREGLSLHVRPTDRMPAERLVMGEFPVQADWYLATRLPDYLDGAAAESTVRDGVLTIRVPRQEASQPRAIAIDFS